MDSDSAVIQFCLIMKVSLALWIMKVSLEGRKLQICVVNRDEVQDKKLQEYNCISYYFIRFEIGVTDI